jgi:dTDP-4-dehydrorhamnose reductase
MKVLIAGAGGQLGKTLQKTAPDGIAMIARDSAGFDLTRDDLDRQLVISGAEVVINCAAYTAVDKAEGEPARAFAVNAEGAARLAAACAGTGARLLHVSTDFVFDGGASAPYRVDAATAPLGVYGASKREGELRVLAALPQAVVVRTAWVYSPFGANFLRTMLRLMGERDSVGVVADQVGTPTSTFTLAAALWRFALRPQLQGVHHFTDAGVASWYDFAVAIQEEALALGLLPRAVPVRPIRTADYPTPARRPAYSVLDKTDTWRALAIEPLHWRAALREVLRYLSSSDQ